MKKTVKNTPTKVQEFKNLEGMCDYYNSVAMQRPIHQKRTVSGYNRDVGGRR